MLTFRFVLHIIDIEKVLPIDGQPRFMSKDLTASVAGKGGHFFLHTDIIRFAKLISTSRSVNISIVVISHHLPFLRVVNRLPCLCNTLNKSIIR